MLTLKAGDKAFIDGFTGLIPCIITRIYKPDYKSSIVYTEAKITKAKLGYEKNEIVTMCSSIVPRSAIRYRKYGTWIKSFERIIS